MMDSIWMNFMNAAMDKKSAAISKYFFGIFYFINDCLV